MVSPSCALSTDQEIVAGSDSGTSFCNFNFFISCTHTQSHQGIYLLDILVALCLGFCIIMQ